MIPFDTSEKRYRRYPLHEFYADEFACALLMPIEDVLICLEERRTVFEMSERWGVPVGAVIAWLRRLAQNPPENASERDLKNLALWAVHVGAAQSTAQCPTPAPRRRPWWKRAGEALLG